MAARALGELLEDMSDRVGSIIELDELLGEITNRLGFDYYALTHHCQLARKDDGAIRLHNYPQSWAESYDSHALGMVDPVHRASHVTAKGFSWSDIGRLIPLTPQDHRMLALGEEQGLRSGFTVPAHVPGEARGSCSFACRNPRDGAPIPLIAHCAGTFAFETARRLWLKRGHSLALRKPVLTDRQRDCVLLMAQGKTDPEISTILGISRETVTEHVRTACQRYGIYKRQLLITLTLYDGTLTFGDVRPWRYPHFWG